MKHWIMMLAQANFAERPTGDEAPKSYRASQMLPDAADWHIASVDELDSHDEMRTWIIVDRPCTSPTASSLHSILRNSATTACALDRHPNALSAALPQTFQRV